MKKLKGILVFLIMSLVVLVGCTSEEAMPTFTLGDMGAVSWDEETPYMYQVNSTRAPEQVILFKYEKISDTHFDSVEETYDIENVSVTDDEIVLAFNDETIVFERLSSSVVQTEDKIQYQYFGPPEEVNQ